MRYDGYVKVAPRIFEQTEKELGPDEAREQHPHP